MKKKYIIYLFLFITTFSCNNDDSNAELSNENEITNIIFNYNDNRLEIAVDPLSKTINKTLPTAWDITNMSAQFIISDSATLSPDPSTISDFSKPITFTVTAQNGEKSNYNLVISKLPSDDRDIISFIIQNKETKISSNINSDSNTIEQRVPPHVDLSQLSINYKISKNASISPDPSTIKDYSNPVSFTVTSESNETKTYTTNFKIMDEEAYYSCTERSASVMIGAVKQASEYFNVGLGQSLTPDNDIFLQTYSILFSRPFVFVSENGETEEYAGDATLRLQLRNENGFILDFKDFTFNNPMESLWREFDLSNLNIILKKNTLYHFTWYIVDGEQLKIASSNTSSTQLYASSFCNGQGLATPLGSSSDTMFEEWGIWNTFDWHFNFKLSGLK